MKRCPSCRNSIHSMMITPDGVRDYCGVCDRHVDGSQASARPRTRRLVAAAR